VEGEEEPTFTGDVGKASSTRGLLPPAGTCPGGSEAGERGIAHPGAGERGIARPGAGERGIARPGAAAAGEDAWTAEEAQRSWSKAGGGLRGIRDAAGAARPPLPSPPRGYGRW